MLEWQQHPTPSALHRADPEQLFPGKHSQETPETSCSLRPWKQAETHTVKFEQPILPFSDYPAVSEAM